MLTEMEEKVGKPHKKQISQIGGKKQKPKKNISDQAKI